jgi:hypothetical protein
MLYTLVGNGDANKKEVLATIESLASSVHGYDDFWMVLCAESQPSKTVTAIVQYLTDMGVYFEIIAESSDMIPAIYDAAQQIHVTNDLLKKIVVVSKKRVQPDEKSAILVMDDNLDENKFLMDVIFTATDADIPVYELGGQMVQIVLEGSDDPVIEEDLTVEEAEPIVIEETIIEEQYEQEFLKFHRPDLEELTLNELKVLANSLNLVPRDIRSKESIIEAILSEEAPIAIEYVEPPVVDDNKYYLMILKPDGSITVNPVDKATIPV